MNSSNKTLMPTIPFSRVVCDGNELKYVREVIESGWLTTAGKCMEFERQFAGKVGGTYACAVNSGTAALHLACEALGIGPGDKVFVPTMTFTATAEVIRYLGADPVFLDVEYGTCLVTPAILDAAIQQHPDARALLLVHFGGQAAQMTGVCGTLDFRLRVLDCKKQLTINDQRSTTDDQLSTINDQRPTTNDSQGRLGIVEICRDHGLKLIEDAAHAFPTRYRDRMIGSFGDATCFSFYANKTITTGQGGMLMTDNEDLFNRARIMRLHGINHDIWDRFTGRDADWEYDVLAPGFKYNLPDVTAAIGLAQLERADEYRRERQRCADFYYRELAGIACLDLPVCHGAREDHSWHLFCVVLNEKSRIERSRFIELVNEAGIGTSVHYKPLHRMTYYRDRYKLRPEDFPNAERHWRGAVSLPIYPSLSPDELACVCETVQRILS
jgi:dTDP-4-amino-4,6-dideoxygalactose transaminase